MDNVIVAANVFSGLVVGCGSGALSGASGGLLGAAGGCVAGALYYAGVEGVTTAVMTAFEGQSSPKESTTQTTPKANVLKNDDVQVENTPLPPKSYGERLYNNLGILFTGD